MKSILIKSAGVILILILLFSTLMGCVPPVEPDDNVTPEHTHIFSWVIDTAPTYTRSGIKHRECKCGEKANENTIMDAVDINDTSKYVDEQDDQLNNFFAQMQSDVSEKNKLCFSVSYQDIHYWMVETGEYADDIWMNANITIDVHCNYNLAKKEDWYKACQEKNNESLNTAFYNEYGDMLSDGHFYPIGIMPTVHLVYAGETHADIFTDFIKDYEVIKEWVDIPCVTKITIHYQYTVAGSFFDA